MSLKEVRNRRKDEAVKEVNKYNVSSMAKVLGVSSPTYRAMENDPSRIRLSEAEKLAEYLKVGVDEIFFGKDVS